MTILLPKAGMNAGPYRYYGATFPFRRNLAKSSNQWVSVPSYLPIILTDDGFPAWLAAGQTAQAWVFHNRGRFSAGTYDLEWAGTGQVTLDGGSAVTEVSSSAVVNNKRSYHVSSNHGNFLRLNILSTAPSNPVRDIQVYLRQQGAEVPDLARPTGSNDWLRPQYLEDLLGFGVIRFMDWGGTNDHPNGSWPHRVKMTSALWGGESGIPYEMQIELCNRLDADMWVTVPHTADDTYVAQLAELIRTNLKSTLRVWVEFSNEVWNSGFGQHRYVRDVLTSVYGQTSSFDGTIRAYGRHAAGVFASFRHVFGPQDAKRVIRVICGQAANPNVLRWAIEGLELATGQQRADVCAIAPYVTRTSFAPQRQARGMAELYQEYLNTGTIDFDTLHSSMRDNISEMRPMWSENVDVAAAHHDAPLVAYEAGQHLVPQLLVGRISSAEGAPRWIEHVGDDDGAIDDEFVELLTQFNRDERMGELYSTLIHQWRTIGGTTIVFYYDMGDESRHGFWGTKRDFQDDTDAVKFNVVKQFATSP